MLKLLLIIILFCLLIYCIIFKWILQFKSKNNKLEGSNAFVQVKSSCLLSSVLQDRSFGMQNGIFYGPVINNFAILTRAKHNKYLSHFYDIDNGKTWIDFARIFCYKRVIRPEIQDAANKEKNMMYLYNYLYGVLGNNKTSRKALKEFVTIEKHTKNYKLMPSYLIYLYLDKYQEQNGITKKETQLIFFECLFNYLIDKNDYPIASTHELQYTNPFNSFQFKFHATSLARCKTDPNAQFSTYFLISGTDPDPERLERPNLNRQDEIYILKISDNYKDIIENNSDELCYFLLLLSRRSNAMLFDIRGAHHFDKLNITWKDETINIIRMPSMYYVFVENKLQNLELDIIHIPEEIFHKVTKGNIRFKSLYTRIFLGLDNKQHTLKDLKKEYGDDCISNLVRLGYIPTSYYQFAYYDTYKERIKTITKEFKESWRVMNLINPRDSKCLRDSEDLKKLRDLKKSKNPEDLKKLKDLENSKNPKDVKLLEDLKKLENMEYSKKEDFFSAQIIPNDLVFNFEDLND